MPEAFSTQNLVVLPITSQELGRGAFLPPNQNRTNHQRVNLYKQRKDKWSIKRHLGACHLNEKKVH